jgi:hypothetical protein
LLAIFAVVCGVAYNFVSFLFVSVDLVSVVVKKTMESPSVILRNHTKVIIHDTIDKDPGFLVKDRHLECRKPSISGIIWGVIPGHGGDVYWVKHGDETIGAYCFTEFELAPGYEAILDVIYEEGPK